MKSVILDVPPFHSDGAQREFEEFSSTLPGPELLTAKYGGGRPHPRDVSRLAYAACTTLALLTVWLWLPHGTSGSGETVTASPTSTATSTPSPTPSTTSSPYERGQQLVDHLGQVRPYRPDILKACFQWVGTGTPPAFQVNSDPDADTYLVPDGCDSGWREELPQEAWVCGEASASKRYSIYNEALDEGRVKQPYATYLLAYTMICGGNDE
ncbi:MULTISPECIES: hypothetical protein [unclassified Corynebacterium]|uniref:hypothetical protein n=1 Tax=Corynebacterium TaxID=1716 RepID=UPI00254EC794|nr:MULTISPECIES: hypothetical protein [unclassified Corynebacterium]MDK8476941.1 hypothetical protein [Corynebacterium sp. MSK310]MDK8673509.1 hypothetical protein [Corynebacterium sp. MSK189]MDK8698706.1 hypothetical protein [Corynebacterium sp. MSK192]MDK8703281.1 hypothetical protein [Corynebacterium sp. MSK107]MDK8705065.1 hypothetical protein [Corynebacterium sp. MSK090]